MGLLFFKKPLQDAIRMGRKWTTIRRWGKPPFRAGGTAYAPGLGSLLIDAVEPIELGNLTDDDARADGFADAASLTAALLAMYPAQATDGKRWFLVRFRPGQLVPGRANAKDDSPGLFDLTP